MVTRGYHVRQAESATLFKELTDNGERLAACNTLSITRDDIENNPPLYGYSQVLEAMCYLSAGRAVKVRVVDSARAEGLLNDRSGCRLIWIASENRFELTGAAD
jgi:hypothetical protein